MAIRNVVQEGDDILTKKCRLVEKFDDKLFDLLDDMADTMYEANGVGLAAPQIGIRRQIVVIDVDDENGLLELINPEIIYKSEETETSLEGCLSFVGQWGLVERPLKVKVKAQDRYGDEFELEGEGLLARCFCHEIDHLSGVSFKSIATRMLTPEEIEAMAKADEEEEEE